MSKNTDNLHLEPDAVYEAIAEGVDRAIWRMITSATDMPCHDFYDAIEKAAKESFDAASIALTLRKAVESDRTPVRDNYVT